ncbi:regulator of G-protein signaling 4 [Poecilia reticulata]|uniref:Regulator of G protein signaling 4 n=1 Tax=Poecilia reticulata TaxID=8081 RepID=A0A3P9P0N1_POERE|nr:PREDICTED: regulator of G-protein signaling 4-like [Poecilia reticulata]
MCKGLATLPATCLKSAKDIKHKISFLLQKPEPQAADQKEVKEKTATAVTKRVPNAAEVEKWKESFCHVMNSEMGRTVFTSFLKSEFSQENVDFWIACEDYKKTPPSKMATKAKQMYQQYVEADAPNEVNLDAATREKTRREIESGGPSCFDEAQKMIYNLMEKDSYRRFLKSKMIQEICQKESCAAQEKKGCDWLDSRQVLAGGA